MKSRVVSFSIEVRRQRFAPCFVSNVFASRDRHKSTSALATVSSSSTRTCACGRPLIGPQSRDGKRKKYGVSRCGRLLKLTYGLWLQNGKQQVDLSANGKARKV